MVCLVAGLLQLPSSNTVIPVVLKWKIKNQLMGDHRMEKNGMEKKNGVSSTVGHASRKVEVSEVVVVVGSGP